MLKKTENKVPFIFVFFLKSSLHLSTDFLPVDRRKKMENMLHDEIIIPF